MTLKNKQDYIGTAYIVLLLVFNEDKIFKFYYANFFLGGLFVHRDLFIGSMVHW
ncbi:hypothetical protein BH09BAC6_BH09BAC6_03400 [soil metagenome]|jgi:hypothetical protein